MKTSCALLTILAISVTGASFASAQTTTESARVDEIAARTRFSKRMIYYYFGDKEGIYLHALENAYRQVREG